MQVHRIGVVSNRQFIPEVKSTNVKENKNVQNEISNIPFYGGVKLSTNLLNAQAKRNKLVKQIDNILKEITLAEMPKEDYAELEYRNIMAFTRHIKVNKERLYDELTALEEDTTSSEASKQIKFNQYYAEYQKLRNARPIYKEQPILDAQTKKLDVALLNRFKTALMNDDYNLGRVFDEYFAPLAGITTVCELLDKFPKIEIPADPFDVVVDKLVGTLTREFYETYDTYDYNGDVSGCEKYVNKVLNEIFEANAPLIGISPEHAYMLFAEPMIDKIIEKHDSIIDDNENTSFSSIPTFRKSNKASISQNDLQLLPLNYDDYVTSVVKKIYLDKQKPKDIVYSNYGTEFALSSVNESAYKFDKIPEKIKGMISDAMKIQSLQRNYDKFDNEELKSRLNYYSNKEFASDGVVFENIINFYNCNFNKEDVACLKEFLRALDLVSDKKMTVQELESKIKSQELIPKGTERLNQQELAELAQQYKVEQKSAIQLSNLKDKFDYMMNILYANGMSSTASMLSKYRPADLSEINTDNTEYLYGQIVSSLGEDDTIEQKTKLEASLLRWDTYNFYKEDKAGLEIINSVEKKILHEYGECSPELVGQYLLSMDIVEDYPKSKNYYKHPEVLDKILDKSAKDKDVAVMCLSKYEDYNLQTDVEKAKLANILEIFDIKNPVEKYIIKHILENDYINLDTESQVDFSGNGKNLVTAVIAPNVKQEIVTKYKFPVCLNYLVAFEEALSKVAASSDSAGIKQTGTNNHQLQYKMELKVNAYRDRLFSSNNDYRFDVYSEKGLH